MKHFKTICLAATAAMVLLAAIGAAGASATTLEVGGASRNQSVSVKSSTALESSAVIKDSAGTTVVSCPFSEINFTTFGPYTGSAVSGPAELWFGLVTCSHTTKVLKSGSIAVEHTLGTNGTIYSAGAEVTIISTAFGVSAVCKTGSGTAIGSLTGVSSGKATLDINGKINCGILGTSTWTGTYNVTSPEGLGLTS